ncbi:hypothetical protein [Brevibacillus reuszeri]|uniref:hypothetical protein n=1 Tax=Brevibacillus reuszeri TaxID=54915 RepID=UPI003D22C16C
MYGWITELDSRTRLVHLIVEKKMEGVVAKLKDGRYHAGKRTDDFVKIVNYLYADVSIAGY